MSDRNEAYRRGLALMNTLYGGQAGEQMIEAMKDICPDFAHMTIERALGGVMACPGLDLKTPELLLVASSATLGNAIPQWLDRIRTRIPEDAALPSARP